MKIELLEIILLFIIPLIIGNTLLRKKLRFFYLFYGLFPVIVVTAIIEKLSFLDLGIRLDNLLPAAAFYALMTAVFSAYIFNNKKKILDKKIKIWYIYGGYFLVFSAAQEFVFRGFLMYKLAQITALPAVIIMSGAIIFWFAHIPFKDFRYMRIPFMSFSIAISALYFYYPNLILASISHSIVNLILVYRGYLTK